MRSKPEVTGQLDAKAGKEQKEPCWPQKFFLALFFATSGGQGKVSLSQSGVGLF